MECMHSAGIYLTLNMWGDIMKRFNVTGLCVPETDYMVDLSGKINQIRELIDDGSYFTINRARQYGKTTLLLALRRALQNDYIVASISFEGMGSDSFSSEETFCMTFVRYLTNAFNNVSAPENLLAEWQSGEVSGFEKLSDHITKACRNHKIILMIDEVDKTSNNNVFLHFLSMLRSKFLARKSGDDCTFHNVILAGVYDIKNIKLKMIQEGSYTPGPAEGAVYNSPWNIAADFKVDMSFCPEEIAGMLMEYECDHQSGMNIPAVSAEIYAYTTGYPFLVSRICRCIDMDLHADWTPGGVQSAVKIIVEETNTLFDDLIKNIENNPGLYDMIYELLILGAVRPYTVHDPLVGLGFRYGFFKKVNGTGIAMSNRIFELVVTSYLVSKSSHSKKGIDGVLQYDVVRDGVFDMELCLRKFAEHYRELFTDRDVAFLESNGRMLFLSYLKPLLNGRGFYHIESQFTDLRRMDLVVDFGRQQFIIELKIWRGEKYQTEAHEQLCAYLDSKNKAEGYLLTFDFRKNKETASRAEWLEVNGKRIFSVII